MDTLPATDLMPHSSLQISTIIQQANDAESPARLRAMIKRLASQLNEVNDNNEYLRKIMVRSSNVIERLNVAKTAAVEAKQGGWALAGSVFHSTSEAMVILRQDGTCKLANEQARTLMDLPVGSLDCFNLLSDLDERFVSEEGRNWTGKVRKELSDSEIVQRQLNYFVDNQARWMELDIAGTGWADEPLFLLIGRDITARKQFELGNAPVHSRVANHTSSDPGFGQPGAQDFMINDQQGNVQFARIMPIDTVPPKTNLAHAPVLESQLESNKRMLADLRQAVSANELTVAYQPKVAAKTNQLCGCEALVRWNHDGLDMSPVEFIEIAEKAGLIHELGDQIIELAMRQTKVWRSVDLLQGKMSINLSPHQLCSTLFVARFISLLNKTDTKAEWFELEITENAMVSNMEVALEHMEQLRQLGVSFAIDDFGTGYSSLNYLRTFPVTTLKIDLSFVKDIPDCTRAIAVAKSILVLGHDLGMTVVAEGVETVQQCEFLEEQGCDILQGFWFSRALEPEGFEAWAISNKHTKRGNPSLSDKTEQAQSACEAESIDTDTIRLDELR